MVIFLSLTMHHVALPEVFVWPEALWADAQVFPDVIRLVPGLVFIMHHEEESKLDLHITPLSVGPLTAAQSTRPAYHQRPEEATVQILAINKPTSQFITWKQWKAIRVFLSSRK